MNDEEINGLVRRKLNMPNTDTENTERTEQGTFKNEKRSNDRTCILSGETKPRAKMIRLVIGPDGSLVPDVAEKLPGRGIWISTNRVMLDENIASGKFKKAVARSLKANFKADAHDLPELIERLLTRRCLDRLGLEQRAGNIVTGFDKIKAETLGKAAGKIIGYVTANDGGDDGQSKLSALLSPKVIISSLFNRQELSQALGKDNAVHVVVFDSGGARVLLAELDRLQHFRAPAQSE